MKEFVLCLCVLFSKVDFPDNGNLYYPKGLEYHIVDVLIDPTDEAIETAKEDFLKIYIAIDRDVKSRRKKVLSERDRAIYRSCKILATEAYNDYRFVKNKKDWDDRWDFFDDDSPYRGKQYPLITPEMAEKYPQEATKVKQKKKKVLKVNDNLVFIHQKGAVAYWNPKYSAFVHYFREKDDFDDQYDRDDRFDLDDRFDRDDRWDD